MFDVYNDPIDVYATGQAYWRSFWHRATTNTQPVQLQLTEKVSANQ